MLRLVVGEGIVRFRPSPAVPMRLVKDETLAPLPPRSQVKRRSAPYGLFLLLSNGSKVAVADQFAPLFVPEAEGEGFKAGEQRDGLHGLK